MFWDIADDVSTDIQSLITAENPDYDAILENSELLRTFIAKDESLINFLTNSTTFDKIISTMMTHKNIKISKVCVELFVAKESPLLKKFITDKTNSISLIKLAQASLDSSDLVRIGFISRIYQKAAETVELQNDFVKLFNSTLEILSFLTKIIYITSVYDLILSYLSIQKPEDQWLVFSYLQMILPKGQSANCPKCFFNYKDNIIGLIKSLSTFKFSPNHKINIINIMKSIFDKEKLPEVVNVVATNISFIYEAETNNNQIRYLLLTLAAAFPPQKAILNISAKLIQKTTSEHYGELENAALNILSLSPSKTLAILIPTIIDKFVKDTTNTFHHMAFVNFVRKSMAVTELKDDLLQKLPPLILENAESSKWRENANRVAFYLELADILDKEDSNQVLSKNDKWKTFRNNELQNWRNRNEGLDEAPEAVAQSKHAIDAAKEDIDFANKPNNQNNGFPAFSDMKLDDNNQEKAVFPEFPDMSNDANSLNKNQEEKPSFPEFPDMSNDANSLDNHQQETPVFPAFPDMPNDANSLNSSQEEKPSFPEFPDMSNDANALNNQKETPEFPEFPSFQTGNEKPKEEKVVFPEFTAEKINNDNGNGFSFPPIDGNDNDNKEPEKVEFGFLTEDEPKQEEKPKSNQLNSFASFAQVKSKPAPASVDLDGDESFEHFMELVNNPCWEYHGPSPEELFGQKDRFSSPEDAFQFLINQT